MVFPGNARGTPAERIARQIFKIISDSKPDLVLDLHNDWRQSIPYTLVDPDPGFKHRQAYSRAKWFARKTGFLMVSEPGDSEDSIEWQKTLSGSLLLHGIPALTIELGEAYIVNELLVRYGVESTWTILNYLGMTRTAGKDFQYPMPQDMKGNFLLYTQHPVSSTSGIIRFLTEPGKVVAKGQTVAKIYNTFGKLLERVQARYEGIVLGHSDTSVAFPGSPVMSFGILKKD